MILRAIEVRAYRSFRDPLRVEFDPELVNVLYGRNGTGKSTLVSAIARGFLEHYGTNANAAREMIPWGTTLAPEVNLEFETGGAGYRIEKRFFSRKSAILSVRKGRHWSAQHESDEAEQKVRAVLHAGTGGYSQAGLAGIGQVLWSVQGALPLMKVDQSVADLVRQSFAVQSESEEARSLFTTVQKLRQRFWADAKDKLKTGKDAPELVSLQERAREKSIEATRWREVHERAEQFRAALATTDETLQRTSETVRRKTEERDRLAQDLAKYTKIRGELDAQEPQLKLLRKEYSELDKSIKRIAALEGEISDARKMLAESEARWVKAIEAEQEALSAWKIESEGKDTHDQVRRLREEIAALCAPSSTELDQIRKLSARRGQLSAVLENAMLHVEFELTRAAELRVVEGEPGGNLPLEPGTTSRVSGSPRIVIEVPDLGTIRVSGPKASVESIRAELVKVQRGVTEGCAPFGTEDLEELERRASRLRQIEAEVREVEARWNAAMASAATRKAIAEMERATFENRREALGRQLDQQERELAELRSDGKTQEERQARFVEVSMLGLALQETAKRLKQELDQFPLRLDELAAAAEAAKGQSEQALERAKTDLIRQRAMLDQILADAPYERLEEAEEALREIERQAVQEQLRADAALLLHKTASAYREKAKAGAGEPLALRATEYLSRIAGRPLGAIRVSDELAPREFVPEGMDGAVGFQRLSGGEAEQVHLAVRLALARVLSDEERQLVVLDDVLTATDDERLARIIEIIEELRPRLQFLVLTCHRERYANLPKACFVDLEAKVRGRECRSTT